MANHSPLADNYVSKKTFDEAMAGDAAGEAPEKEQQKSQDAAKRATEKGEAARNGGGGVKPADSK